MLHWNVSFNIIDERLKGVWYWFFNPANDVFEATQTNEVPEGYADCWMYYGMSEDGEVFI